MSRRTVGTPSNAVGIPDFLQLLEAGRVLWRHPQRKAIVPSRFTRRHQQVHAGLNPAEDGNGGAGGALESISPPSALASTLSRSDTSQNQRRGAVLLVAAGGGGTIKW